ncbi:MAG: hypothetical protein IKW71_00075, partial [Elusimicrobiaceae bacterium]|nr:hypothetical protein [Elusimicrobiaceae bacterium]
SYLHDKHAAFFNIISQTAPQAINEDAFWKHQNVLEKMLSGLETHYLIANRKRFASSVFSETEIAHMQTPVLQPPAYMLHMGELRYFADLPSLDAQRKWVADTITYIQADIQALLTKDTTSLQLNEFERYYTQNIRLHYFKSLAGVLAAQRNGKRPSAIIRLRMAVPQGNFGTQKLTDAQRAGYLQFINDTQGTITTNELKNFNETYGHYAVAEALKAPYEIALQYSMYAPELLGMEEGTRLRQLSPEDCLQELLPQINTLEAQLINLRQHALHTREFYGSYYQLHAKQQIYKTLTARAQTMLNWKHD